MAKCKALTGFTVTFRIY